MQQLNRAMTSMARVLHAIDNNPTMTGVSDEMVDMVDEMRDTFWDLKRTYPNYATDRPYNIAPGSGQPGLLIMNQGQWAQVNGGAQPGTNVIIIEDDII